MIAEDRLIAWLCIMHWQWTNDTPLHMPGEVHEALVARGWYTYNPEPDWDGHHFANVTPAGRAVIDLNGPEWGLNTLQESEA